jgi:lipopolysaccharide/colanic/teichoic acid biosynthesis glycosyltransferase
MAALRTDSPCAHDRFGRRFYLAVKTLLERAGALLLLVVLSPLMALTALLVRLASPGPALYRQRRLGKEGRHFTIYKMRTMTHDCEACSGPVWAQRHDPRVTPLERLLRDTHLDELPQLWNVVRGEMGLIGPRPERPEIAGWIEQELPDFSRRLRVRPGLTGLAQVRLPADCHLDDTRRKLAMDLYYIEKLNLILDVRIAVATVFLCAAPVLAVMGRLIVRSCGPMLRRTPLVKPLVNRPLTLTISPGYGSTSLTAGKGEGTRRIINRMALYASPLQEGATPQEGARTLQPVQSSEDRRYARAA